MDFEPGQSDWQKQLEEEHSALLARFVTFLKEYKRRNETEFFYRAQLIDNHLKNRDHLDVWLEDLIKFDNDLAQKLVKSPSISMSLFESAAIQLLQDVFPEELQNSDRLQDLDVHVQLHTSTRSKSLRSLSADRVHNIIGIPGVVVSVSSTCPKPIALVYLCRKCRKKTTLGMGEEKICSDLSCDSRSLTLVQEEGTFVDQQFIKVQESPEEVPTGEIPRTVSILCERKLVDIVSAGSRVIVTGIQGLSAASRENNKGNAALREVNSCLIHALGIQMLGSTRTLYVSPEEEEIFREFSRSPDVHEKIFRSIAPQISGDYTKDLKKAIACLLFSGSRRVLEDKTTLRGDINVLLIGDPSLAKSQFLKFAHKVAPISVYTSGKGSSAAGLTAAVLKNPKGQFYVEAGAMVLADAGVVCIDEFDKMRDQDRVAIHEAMEQQTISIAKAGITTQLNSRTSVLAAANPVFGTYDDFKSSAENIDFLPTILSRFDLIFIIKDVRNADRDLALSSHILNLHAGNANSSRVQADKRKFSKHASTEVNLKQSQQDVLDVDFLKKYIAYCKQQCTPTLTEEAGQLLINSYVSIRAEAAANAASTQSRSSKRQAGGKGSTIPITVRQLEAIARLAESLAKMELKTDVSEDHVTEALRLFRVATVNASSTSKAMGDLTKLDNVEREEIENVESFIRSFLPIGAKTAQRKVMQELVDKRGYSKFSVRMAFQMMLKKGEIKHLYQKKFVQRVQ